MLVKSQIFTGMSGKVGGLVLSHNRFGLYARAWATPVNPNTDRQVTARARLAQLADRWNTILTQLQRDAWDLYAASITVPNRLGDSVYLTGFNHYLRSNCAILACGGTIVDDGPALFLLPEEDPAFAITASEATQLISVAFDVAFPWLDEDGGFMLVAMGQPQLSTVKFFGGPYRVIGAIAGDDTVPPTTPKTFAAAWPIAEDQLIWAQARIVRADGRVSGFFRDVAPCSA